MTFTPSLRPARPHDDPTARAPGPAPAPAAAGSPTARSGPVGFTATSVVLGAQDGFDAPVMGLAVHGDLVLATHYLVPAGQGHVPAPGTLMLRDRTDLSPVAAVPVGSMPRKVAVHAGREKAYVVNYQQGSVTVVDIPGRAVAATVPIGQGTIDIAVDPVADRVYVTNWYQRRIEVIDAATDTRIAPIPLGAHNRTPLGIDVDPDTGTVYVAISYHSGEQGAPPLSAVAVVDGTGGTVRQVLPVPPADRNQPVDVVFVPAGAGAAGSPAGGPARVVVGALGRPGVPPSVVVLPLDGGAPVAVATNSNVSMVAVDAPVGLAFTATAKGGPQAVDLAAGAVVGTAADVKNPVSVAVADDGVVYVGGDRDGRLTRLVTDVVRPTPPVTPALAMSSNGGRFTLFRQRPDGEVEATRFEDFTDWSPWQGTGMTFPAGTPLTTLARRVGHWELFAVDDAGQLWGCAGDGDAADAAGWRAMGPPVLAPGGHTAAVSIDGSGVAVFSVGADGMVRSFAWDDAGPGQHVDHPGATFPAGAPLSVVSRKGGHWDAFVVHDDGRVWSQWWSTDEDAFSPWAPLGGGGALFRPGAHVSALSRRGDHLDLFAVGTDGFARTTWWSDDEQWWHDWGVIPGARFATDARVHPMARQAEHIDLFAVDEAGTVHTAWWSSEPGWSGWQAKPMAASTPRAAVVAGNRSDKEIDVVWSTGDTSGAPGAVVGTQTAWWNPWHGWSCDQGIVHEVPTDMVPAFFERLENDEEVDGQLTAKFWRNGTYSFRGHVHGGAVDPFDFVYRALVVPASGAIVFPHYHEGHVDGWDPWDPFEGDDPGRDADWAELGTNPMVGTFFTDLPAGTMHMSERHENVGFGGVLEDVVNFFVDDFLVAYLTQNPQLGVLGAVVALGGELLDAVGVDSTGPGGMAGVILAGGMLFVQAPGLLLPVAVAGVVGAATLLEHRAMREEEEIFADAVFAGTLPPRERIRITNLSGLGGKPFVTKVPDGSYLVNLASDDAFEDPIGWVDPDDPNDRPGRLFIHELTHVWDVRRASSSFRWIAEAGPDALFGSHDVPGPDEEFERLSPEGKAAVVAEAWYVSNIVVGPDGRPDADSLLLPAAVNDRYFHYVSDHIRVPQDEES